MTEQEELEQDAGALAPTIAALLTAAAAYDVATRPGQTIADALKVTAAIEGILLRIAMKIVSALASGVPKRYGPRNSKVEPEVLERVFESVDRVAKKAVTEAVETVSTAINAVAADRDTAPQLSNLPDRKSVDLLAMRTATTIRNASRYHFGMENPDIALKKTWHSVKDTRTRASHAFLGDRSYEYHTVAMGDDFISISGARLRFPGDPTAPLDEIFRCRCWMTIR